MLYSLSVSRRPSSRTDTVYPNDIAAPLAEPRSGSPPDPGLSRWGTALAATVFASSCVLFAWLYITIPRLERVSAPEQALALMVGRTFDLEEALPHAEVWERLLYELNMESAGDRLDQAIEWYRELAAYSTDPIVSLQLAILEGEAGRIEHLRARVSRWGRDNGELTRYADWIAAAYLNLVLPIDTERRMQAELAETVTAGWFYDKLALRLATRAGDRALLAVTAEAPIQRGQALLARLRGVLLADLGIILLGVVAAGTLLQRPDRRRWRIGTAAIPPPWRGRTGMAVLIRGGAIGAVLTLVYVFEDTGESLFRFAAVPLVNLPLLWLTARHLTRPFGATVPTALGGRTLPGAWGRLLLVGSALLAIGFAGEWLIAVLAESLGWSSHWTEWFDSDLIWGESSIAAAALVEYVLFAPVFEEVVFRGLLFATLRRRFALAPSAVISGAVFGLAHGYGWLGFVSVLWSGILWAWAYEKTGSLYPGILAHAVNNLLVCLTVMLLLRV